MPLLFVFIRFCSCSAFSSTSTVEISFFCGQSFCYVFISFKLFLLTLTMWQHAAVYVACCICSQFTLAISSYAFYFRALHDNCPKGASVEMGEVAWRNSPHFPFSLPPRSLFCVSCKLLATYFLLLFICFIHMLYSLYLKT